MIALRLPAASLDLLRAQAEAAGVPLRTWMQRHLESLAAHGPEESGAVLREVQKVSTLVTKLWLGTAENQKDRAEILRIAHSVRGGVQEDLL